MGPENVTKHKLCFIVVGRAFLFQFWAGSSAFSTLNAYLVFSQQICLKIVLQLHCPERLKIDVVAELCDNTAENKNKSSLE